MVVWKFSDRKEDGMSLIVWNESLSVGVPEFDSQHKQLVSLINELHEAMRSGKGKDVLATVLHNLVKYTKTHFAAEERYMQARKYAAYSSHKTQHDHLTHKVSDFQKQFLSGKVALSLSVMNFLKDWLTQHIMQEDKKYSPSPTG
jgi:hemerythrin